jgi:hypothetical protein
MLKKIALALMPLALVATSSAKADDGLSVDVASISDANVEIVTNDVDIDVDALSANAGEESEDAIAACFRRFGYNRRSWGRSYHNSRYSQCYNSCYNYCRPLYSYRTICYSPPVYRCVVTPIYHYYWGCH